MKASSLFLRPLPSVCSAVRVYVTVTSEDVCWKMRTRHTKRQVHKCKILQHALSRYVYNRIFFCSFYQKYVFWTCGDGVSLTFLAVMRCSLIFFAVLRCSEPPPPPPCPPPLSHYKSVSRLYIRLLLHFHRWVSWVKLLSLTVLFSSLV